MLLLESRSILVQCLALAMAVGVQCQSYDLSPYDVESEVDRSEYASDVESGSNHPDYSKFYSLDEAAHVANPLVQDRADSGFVNPAEFSTFLASPGFAFGASNNQEILKPVAPVQKDTTGFVSEADKEFRPFSEYDANGFGAQDYFEQAQKNRQQEEQSEEGADELETPQRPGYISRNSQPSNNHEDEVESFRINKQHSNEASDDVGSSNENTRPGAYTEDFKPSPILNVGQFQPSTPDTVLAGVGDITKLPYVSQFYNKYTQSENPTKPVAVTPYQKYSFRPVGSENYDTRQVSPGRYQNRAPYNPNYLKVSATNNRPGISSAPKGKECIKVNKHVSDKNSKLVGQPMQCYVCSDPKSGAKYERCSYSNEPSPKSYYTSVSSGDSYRNKRDESESYADPYEELKSKSNDYRYKPADFDKDFYKTPSFEEFYASYDPQPESEATQQKDDQNEENEKSYSEMESEKLIKQANNCKKATKNGVTCTVCSDPKTGANFEQCSYESEPNEKKYAYVSNKKFDGNGDPVDEKQEDEQESKSAADVSRETPNEEVENEGESSKDDVKSIRSERGPQKFANFEDYHLKLFPQLSEHQESRRQESKTQPDNAKYFEDLSAKKDVEQVLEEFSRKDRSKCKQINKKGMTCYQCTDKNGIQHEECMFVSESKPQSSHLAYHEMARKTVPEKQEAESRLNPVINEDTANITKTTRKTFFKKANLEDQDSKIELTTPISFESTKISTKVVVKREVDRADDSSDPVLESDVEDERGLYSDETDPVFSKKLGLSLPKYMIEKTDLEEDFDRTTNKRSRE